MLEAAHLPEGLAAGSLESGVLPSVRKFGHVGVTSEEDSESLENI